MAQTYTSLHYHCVFSTKYRQPWITAQFEPKIWAYLGGIARKHMMKALLVGGVEDHIHLLLGMPPTMSVSKAMQLIKGGSSKWIHDTFPALRAFDWQDGYSAFTVSKSNVEIVTKYIQDQRTHHRDMTFQAELLTLLQLHEVEYDERYLWE